MKKIGIVMLGFAIVILLGVTLLLGKATGNGTETNIAFDSEIECVDGELRMNGEKENVMTIPIDINYQLNYEMQVRWWEENNVQPGFLTALLIKDEAGKVVNYVTGDVVDAHLSVKDLTPGRYMLTSVFYNDEKEFRAMLTGLGVDISGEEKGGYDDFTNFGQDGIWTMHHTFGMAEHSGYYTAGYIVGVILGLAVAGAGICILIYLTTKNGSMKYDYDERQILARGKSFQSAFYTMVIYFMIYTAMHSGNLNLPIDYSLLAAIGVCLGVVVFAGNAIMKDAYFALNEKKKLLLVVFFILGIGDLALGIRNIIAGIVIVNGVLTDEALPLVGGTMFVLLFAILLIKALMDKEDE